MVHIETREGSVVRAVPASTWPSRSCSPAATSRCDRYLTGDIDADLGRPVHSSRWARPDTCSPDPPPSPGAAPPDVLRRSTTSSCTQENPMATLLYRLGKTAYRRWPVFIAAWLVALIGLAALAGVISKPMVDTFSIPGIPSLKAQDTQKELFPDTAERRGPRVRDASSSRPPRATPCARRRTPTRSTTSSPTSRRSRRCRRTRRWPTRSRPPTRSTSRPSRVRSKAGHAEGARPRPTRPRCFPLSEDGRVGTISWDLRRASVADVEPADPGEAARRARPRRATAA